MVSTTRIKILKDTPFDKGGITMNLSEFKLKYGYICTNNVTDERLIQYLKECKPHKNPIGDWFAIEEELPLTAIINGLVYSKQMDGCYYSFLPGSPLTPEYSTGCISIQYFTILWELAKYKTVVPYAYNNVKCKP